MCHGGAQRQEGTRFGGEVPVTEAFRRELELLQAQGHRHAAADLLRTQLETGALTAERLRLACYLGHELSCAVLSGGGDDGAKAPEASDAWVDGLVDRCSVVESEGFPPGKEALLWATHAACRVALRHFEARAPSAVGPWQEALEGFARWLASPDPGLHLEATARVPRPHAHAGATLPRSLFVLLQGVQALLAPRSSGDFERQALYQAVRLDAEGTRSAVREVLVPWCLKGSSATV
ncbi:MAG: hypothetical protein D6731_05795 [Planctomycetota bacterium]|nr:MAG: hypothetical protein D6731_05795 [Planctomycetota bacterium]